jgi:hypothetical protein
VGELLAHVTSAPANEFWWGAALTLLAVGVCAWQSLRHLGHQRLIENTPRSLIRSAAQGYVELQGHATLLEGEPIFATLSGAQCVWFCYRVERKERTPNHRGQAQTRWRTVDRGVSEHLFALVDPTGSCVIDPDGAHVTASLRNCWYGHTPQPPRIPAVTGWTRWLGLAALARSYRYTEERIAIGAPLYALGMFRSHTGVMPGPDATEVAALLREWKRDQIALKRRFDANQDSVIDDLEWATARRAAADELANAAPCSALPPAVDTLVDTHDAQRPFLISAATEETLARRAQWQGLLFGSLAFAGGALLVWGIAVRLSLG